MRMTKRLRQELNNLISCGAMIIYEEKSITIYFPIVFNKSIVKIQRKYNIEPLIIITLNDRYPFQAPKVKYFDKDIQQIYRTNFVDELNELTYQEGNCILCDKEKCSGCLCMCCSTIICRNNWYPQRKIIDIINECKKYINIKSRLIERIHCKKIQEKYLYQIPVNYLPIHNYL